MLDHPFVCFNRPWGNMLLPPTGFRGIHLIDISSPSPLPYQATLTQAMYQAGCPYPVSTLKPPTSVHPFYEDHNCMLRPGWGTPVGTQVCPP